MALLRNKDFDGFSATKISAFWHVEPIANFIAPRCQKTSLQTVGNLFDKGLGVSQFDPKKTRRRIDRSECRVLGRSGFANDALRFNHSNRKRAASEHFVHGAAISPAR